MRLINRLPLRRNEREGCSDGDDDKFLTASERLSVATGMVWCALVGCIVLATNGTFERKTFAGRGELNLIGDHDRSDENSGLYNHAFLVSSQNTDEANDPRAADPTMPLFHFVPWPFDWMNDPNGPMYDPVHDMYHLFYQYQTPRMWGHAISRDLVDWEQLPMALTRQRSYDEFGDYSGSATVLDDAARTPLLTVSSSTNDVIWLAVPRNRSDPYLTEWDYVQSNPIIVTDARDPTELFKTAWGAWRMAVGTDHGTVLWEAPDLESVMRNDGWRELGPLAPPELGLRYYECPDFFELPGSQHNGKPLWVHKWSAVGLKGDWWQSGTYDEKLGIFHPLVDPHTGVEKRATLIDENLYYYAAKTFLDNKGCDFRIPREGTKLSKLEQRGKLRSGVTRENHQPRRVMWAWLHGPHGSTAPGQHIGSRKADRKSWQSALGVPRVVEAAPDGTSIVSYPIPELSRLRNRDPRASLSMRNLQVLQPFMPLAFHGEFLDIEASIRFSGSAAAFHARSIACGFRVLWRNQSGSSTAIARAEDTYIDVLAEMSFGKNGLPVAKSLIVVDTNARNLNDDTEQNIEAQVKRYGIPANNFDASSMLEKVSKKASLRILVDRSIVETFVDGGLTTASVYQQPLPHIGSQQQPAAGLAVVSRKSDGGLSCEIERLDVWQMRPFSYSTKRCKSTGAHFNCL